MKPITVILLLIQQCSVHCSFLQPGIFAAVTKQHPMDHAGPGLELPAARDTPSDGPVQQPKPGSVMLSDVMGRDRSINIFAGFTRNIESVSRRLDNAGQNTTVLAPLNSAIEGLPRKPWEDPRDYGAFGADAYEGEDGAGRAQKNLQRFVEAQYVTVNHRHHDFVRQSWQSLSFTDYKTASFRRARGQRTTKSSHLEMTEISGGSRETGLRWCEPYAFRTGDER
jgi:hypothetical protein